MEIISNKPLKPEEKLSCKKTVPSSMQEKPSCYEAIPSPPRGKPGPKGDAATIEIAGVHTIEPTDPARVENVGDENAAKLHFYIPKGDPGNKGDPGKNYVLTEADKEEIASMIDVNVDGVVGGYYTPEVSQVDENTMKVSFTASGDKMPPVQSTEIALPAGKAGKDGKDGQDGYTPQKGVDYFDGKDGISASHRWDGTTLTITSASGTSSANLKGDKGDTGASGNDYILTEADKQEIAGMVDVTGSGVIAQPEQPIETGVLWLDTDDESSVDTYTKTEIDAMFGSYITDIDALVGGDS